MQALLRWGYQQHRVQTKFSNNINNRCASEASKLWRNTKQIESLKLWPDFLLSISMKNKARFEYLNGEGNK